MKTITVAVTNKHVVLNDSATAQATIYNKSNLWMEVKPLDAFVLGYAFNRNGKLVSCTVHLNDDLTYNNTSFYS